MGVEPCSQEARSRGGNCNKDDKANGTASQDALADEEAFEEGG